MRKHQAGRAAVQAISGTHVVLLCMNMEQVQAHGLMGFAIQREDLFEQEITWLRGNKSFASVRPSLSAYESVSSLFHPFQAFQWADYSVKPGRDYIYRVFPMYGRPGTLLRGNPTVVPITSETAEGGTHHIYFNRGAIASQAYSKRFGPFAPERIGPEAFNWLARDLLSGMLDFILRAQNEHFALYGAIYEMRYEPVLQAFRQAHLRGAGVHLIYDAGAGTSIAQENEQMIEAAQIKSLCTGRKNAQLMHNKFIVLVRDNQPVAVWTGSTNLSTNAFFGQLNVGHAIEDRSIAGAYWQYWQELKTDPAKPECRQWIQDNNQAPPEDVDRPLTVVFSPHRGKRVFDWYTQIAAAARQTLFMTFPFGIVQGFRPVFNHRDQVLRYALLEKYVNGGTAASRQKAIAEIKAIRRLPNVGMALAGRIFTSKIDGWLLESKGLGTWVDWVHTKFMLVDPLSEMPVTISGSANWSEPGTNANDENMVIIRGDKRVADIYFTEFMRIFSHHRFRESLAIHLAQSGHLDDWKPRDLAEDSDQWLHAHYDPGNERFMRRIYFSQGD